MAAFQCQVCFEWQTERLTLPPLSTINGEKYRGEDCLHPICITCMAAHVRARVEEQLVFGVRCPMLGCKHELHEQDIHRLVLSGALSCEISRRFSDLRARDFSARALDLSKFEHEVHDLVLFQKLYTSMRLCPRCHVAIQRSQGCNSFGCICGHRFNYNKAPRICSGLNNDIISFAIQNNMSLPAARQEASLYGGVKNLERMRSHAKLFGVSMAEAKQRSRMQGGIQGFEHLISQAAKRGISLHAAEDRAAVCFALKNFKKIRSSSEEKGWSMKRAELSFLAYFGFQTAIRQLKEHRLLQCLNKKVVFLTEILSIPTHDASQILQSAQEGDETAWAAIRDARQRRRSEGG
mmetsp:Transcript_79612/g.138167  ORF Transcript_79612/g.138167 Transcript_79612/m.138167 type:complete len:350 (-) Transcript_79612:118-1167(-)